MVPSYKHALIVGAGPGLSASLARLFADEGLRVTLAARSTAALAEICADIGAEARACDATSHAEVTALFQSLETNTPDVVVFNPAAREHGPVAEIDPEGVREALMVTAYGGFLVAQAAVKLMLPHGHGWGQGVKAPC